jgi:hypothetical protein
MASERPEHDAIRRVRLIAESCSSSKAWSGSRAENRFALFLNPL